jgi:transcriptional regulator with XRE-family HTH domain
MDRILIIMARRTTVQHPAVGRLLHQLGENIRLARLRRKFSAQLVAERAGMSRTTLRGIERGEAGVTLGAYANVLHCLGLHEDLGSIARDDVLGRKLRDLELTTGRRVPRKRSP